MQNLEPRAQPSAVGKPPLHERADNIVVRTRSRRFFALALALGRFFVCSRFCATAFVMGEQAMLDEVAAEIKAVNAKLEEVEADIKQACAEHNAWREEQLRKEKEQLHKEKEQLRTEKLILLKRQSGAPSACVLRSHISRVRSLKFVRQAAHTVVPKGTVPRRLRVRRPLLLRISCSAATLMQLALLLVTGPFHALETLLKDQLKASASAAEFHGVLRCMRMRFPEQTRLAEQHGNQQLAVDTYTRARVMPATVTLEQMAADGYRIGEPIFQGSDILLAYKDCLAKVVKPLRLEEALRIRKFLAVRGDLLNAHVVPFELQWEGMGNDKSFMVMPKYSALLEPMQPLSPAHAGMLWEHMLSALEYLHALGFAHCDVKPGNICVQEPVSFVLIDLGSISAFGSSTASTDAYVPRDVKGGRSSPALDWWMLGITLAEKCCGDASLDAAPRSRSITRSELLAHLQTHLPSTVWEAYCLKASM